jgi:transcriptional regulator with XRE-family HTH domain
MDNRVEVREFLSTRRAKLTVADVGLPDVGTRRVPGLRRGEVAALAGVSIEYYSRLERGALAGVSASVLDAIARALRLDDAERAHLFHLAQAADGTSQLLGSRRRVRRAWTPRPSLTWVLDTITGGPALVRNGRMDLLATNPLGCAMHASLYERSSGPVPNFARYTFLDQDAQRFYPDWGTAADTCVAILRTEAGRDPHDPLMHDLVGELATRSDEFRRRWSRHDVRLHGASTCFPSPGSP